jgi:hypothetical protein
MKALIVAACDRGYFDLLRGLVLSIRDKPEGRDAALGFIDVGLLPEQRDWVSRQGAKIADGRWRFGAAVETEKLPRQLQALTCRAHLPDYFPGFDVYLWLDSDTWVQDWTCVELYFRAAADGALAITPEVDRTYDSLFAHAKSHQQARQEKWTAAFGAEVADRYYRSPSLNAGIFALSAMSRVWPLYRRYLDVALENGVTMFSEQLSLCRAAFELGNNALLPARCNWMCLYSEPRFDRSRGLFVEPAPPFQTIGIVHLAGAWKRRDYLAKGLLYRRGAYLREP